MEITLSSLFINFGLLVFSVVLVYLVIVYPGQIQYAVLEGHPGNYKKRKATAGLNEEVILSTPVDIELPENLEEELITFEEDLEEVDIIPIHETIAINSSNQEANEVSVVQKDTCEPPQSEFEMWTENEKVISSIKKEIELVCNFSTAEEGLDALKTPSEIINRLQTGFDLWAQKTGQKGVTYSQMREMFG
jgi:hypothetical protein